MKIAVVNGTEKKGCTWQLKQLFLQALGEGHEVSEVMLPRDLPEFCRGCAGCVIRGESACPHAEFSVPIWETLRNADLLVFTSPVYVFHTTGAMKNLLDHFCCKWMAHRPDPAMFRKRAVVLTSCLGMGSKSTVRDISDSLKFWGLARVDVLSFALFEIDWSKVGEKKKRAAGRKVSKLAKKIVKRPSVRPGISGRARFAVMRFAQKSIHKKFRTDGLDYAHWTENGWLGSKRPWKDPKRR